MSVETKCSECGEWYGIGTSHKVGEPCRMCRSKAGAIPGQSLSEYQHQECVRLQLEQSGTHVIPLGAPMVPSRNPTASLLEAVAIQNLQDAAGQQSPEIHKAMVDALTQRFVDDEAEDFDSLKSQFDGIKSQVQMVPGRKLTEALLESGKRDRPVDLWGGFDPSKMVLKSPRADDEISLLEEMDDGERRRLFNDRYRAYSLAQPSLIRLIGSIAWRLLLVMVVVGVIVAVLVGGRA